MTTRTIISAIIVIFAITSCQNNDKKADVNTKDSTSVTEVKVSKVESSGFLKSGKDSYKPENLIDGDLKTWWTPNPKRDGVGSSVTFYFENEVEISSMEILNGSHFPNYPKFGDIFKLNNRLKVATITFPTGKKYCFRLNDVDLMQAVNFPAIKTKSLKLTVEGTFQGEKWSDLCVSEVKFFNGSKSNNNIESKPYSEKTAIELSYDEFIGTFYKGEHIAELGTYSYDFKDEKGNVKTFLETSNYDCSEGNKINLLICKSSSDDKYSQTCKSNPKLIGKKFKIISDARYITPEMYKDNPSPDFIGGDYIISITQIQ